MVRVRVRRAMVRVRVRIRLRLDLYGGLASYLILRVELVAFAIYVLIILLIFGTGI